MRAKRSQILINKDFQLRFTFYVCSWLFTLSLFYPVVIYQLFDFFIRYAALDPMGPALAQLQETRQDMLWLLVSIQTVFLVITAIISIFLSHRIAGPIFKLRKFFGQVRSGKWDEELRFRKNDHFSELAVDYNQMMASVRGVAAKNQDSARAAIVRIEKAMEFADKPGRKELEEALAALREIGERSPAPKA